MPVVTFFRRWATGLDPFENFFAVHLNIFWRVDANAHLHPFYAKDGDFDVVMDDDAFAYLAGEYQHEQLLE